MENKQQKETKKELKVKEQKYTLESDPTIFYSLGLDYAPNAEGKDMKYVYEYNRKFQTHPLFSLIGYNIDLIELMQDAKIDVGGLYLKGIELVLCRDLPIGKEISSKAILADKTNENTYPIVVFINNSKNDTICRVLYEFGHKKSQSDFMQFISENEKKLLFKQSLYEETLYEYQKQSLFEISFKKLFKSLIGNNNNNNNSKAVQETVIDFAEKLYSVSKGISKLYQLNRVDSSLQLTNLSLVFDKQLWTRNQINKFYCQGQKSSKNYLFGFKRQFNNSTNENEERIAIGYIKCKKNQNKFVQYIVKNLIYLVLIMIVSKVIMAFQNK